jgi:hypothetical protein
LKTRRRDHDFGDLEICPRKFPQTRLTKKLVSAIFPL